MVQKVILRKLGLPNSESAPGLLIHLAQSASLCACEYRRHNVRVSPSFTSVHRALVITVFFTVFLGLVSAQQRSIHAQRAAVQFLAASTLYRTTWGMNEDIYFAYVTFSTTGERTFARLIDEYYNWAPPISTTALRSKFRLTVNLIRDEACDMQYGKMLLRTAPGDSRAILSERFGYQPKFVNLPSTDVVLPCYRTVRRRERSHVVRILSAIVRLR
jgi:hypothetical protein